MTLKILSEQDWLNMFNTKNITKSFFFKKYKVKILDKEMSLASYMKKQNINKSKIPILYYFFVENKLKYLKNFYNRSLKVFPCKYNKDKSNFSNSKNPRCKNLVRNIYYRDILLLTQTDIKNLRPFLEVIIDLFNNNTIDYKLLTPSAISMYEKNIFSSVLAGFYFRSSILNPNVINNLSEILKSKIVFTPTLGWSSYMLGFMNNNKVKEYVGTDVIPEVCKNTRLLAKKNFPNKKSDIYCVPSEKLSKNRKFRTKYISEYFDTIFFSPPYYKLEIYRGNNQSTNLYNTYEKWLDKYWEQTIKLCRKVIKKNGKLCYIISNYANKLSMNDDMNKITSKYFKKLRSIPMLNSNVDFTKHRDTGETIFIFKPK